MCSSCVPQQCTLWFLKINIIVKSSNMLHVINVCVHLDLSMFTNTTKMIKINQKISHTYYNVIFQWHGNSIK